MTFRPETHTETQKFLRALETEQVAFVRSLPLERAAKLFGSCFAELWLGDLEWGAEKIDAFFNPGSALVALQPASFVRALLETATTHAEITGWQRDQIYAQVDQFLDGYFGLNFVAVENRIEGQTSSRHGPAAWSEANPESGWLTNYADFYFLVQELGLPPGATLVDIGSGHGRTGLLVGLLFTELRYEGYEIVPERANEAARLGQTYPNIHFSCQDVAALEKWPSAQAYYLYDALNVETARQILDRIAKESGSGSRLVVRDGKGIALGLLKSDRRFKKLVSFIGDERLYQPVTIFDMRR